MDDFTIYDSSFDACLDSLSKVLDRLIETNPVLNFEKCHSMVHEGIVLGHLVSMKVMGDFGFKDSLSMAMGLIFTH